MNQETQSLEALLKALRVLLTVLLTLTVIAVICFRLFAYAFTSRVAAVLGARAGGVLAGLLIMLLVPQPVRRIGAVLLLVLYALSIAFFGWRHVMELYASGRAVRLRSLRGGVDRPAGRAEPGAPQIHILKSGGRHAPIE